MGFLDGLFKGDTEGAKWHKEDQTPDEIELCGYIKSKVEDVRSSGSRISHEGIWMTNIAYLLGFDSIYYDTTTRQFRPVGQASKYLRRNRVHINKILPTIQNRLARLCKNPPRYDVRPNSNEQDDKDTARQNLEILNMLWEKESVRLNEQRIPLFMWTQQCGHAFVKISWDDTIGECMYDPETGEMMGYEGDVRADICSAFEIFVDPLAKTLEDAQWVVQAKVRKLDYFRMHYPERGDQVKEEGAWLLSTQYEQRINSLNSAGPMASATNMQMKNAAIELAYYEKRSKKHPNGRQCVVANGILLQDDDLTVGEIPFAKFDDIMIAGKFYSEAIITHLRPPQDQINRIYTLRAAWTNKMLTGKYIAAKGHGLTQEALNDQNGEVVEYEHVPNAAPPTALVIPTIPQYAYTEEQNLEKQFYDISGINEVSRGQLPAAGIPAVGMQLLTEQDETRIGIMTEASENSWAKVGKLLLMFAQKQYKTPRLLKAMGKHGEYNVKSFVGQDIKGNVDVTVIRGSTIPGSKAMKRQELLNLFSQGLLGDPADAKVRQKVLDMLEYGDVSEVWLDQSIDMNQIKRSIEMIENGQVPQVSELDNHDLHIQEKNRYRKSDKFDTLAPEIQQIFMQDIDTHLNFIVELSSPPGAIEPPNPDEQAQEDMMAEQGMQQQQPMAGPEGAPIEQTPEG